MDKSTKILCVCQKGNCRSVGTRYRLNRRGFNNVIAIGATNTSQETLKMLCDWADKIFLSEPIFADNLSNDKDTQVKIDKNFTLGPDIWNNPLHPELQILIRKNLDSLSIR